MSTSIDVNNFGLRLAGQNPKMARRGRLGILRISPPADQHGKTRRLPWQGYDMEPHGITFESIEDLNWAVEQLRSPVGPESSAQFFEQQLVILEDLGQEWVKRVVDLFKVPVAVFAYHEVSPGDYATGRARLPLGEQPEQHFFLPYRETLSLKIMGQLKSHDEYRLSCGSVRMVDQKTSSENGNPENATCEAAVSYWATFESPNPEPNGAWTGIILVDPRPASFEDGPIIRASHDTRGKLAGKLPDKSQTPKPDVQVSFSPAPELPALQVDRSSGPNYRAGRPILLRRSAEKETWEKIELTASTSAANSSLSMFNELMISQPSTASFHPVCSTKTVRRLVLAKMSLVVDYFMKRAFVLTYLAMQNITSITQFDFTKLDNNPWQDEWRSEFFSNLWELREDIEMLGSEMSRTRRLVKVLAELTDDEVSDRRSLRNKFRRDQDFEEIDQWEELEATREYSAQLLQRTTDSYVQAAAAEGAKFANIQAVGSKRVTALASLFVPASLCAAVLAIPNAFQGVNHNQMFWIFWVVSVPLAVILALVFFTKLGQWLQKLPLRTASHILLRSTAPTDQITGTSPVLKPKNWAELITQRRNRQLEKQSRQQEKWISNA